MTNPKDASATGTDAGALSNMQTGDVLVARPSSVVTHDISIVPAKPHATMPNHREAVEQATEEAEARGVDAWVTEDQTHVIKLASNRPDTQVPGRSDGEQDPHKP
jgi:hypothetical protein